MISGRSRISNQCGVRTCFLGRGSQYPVPNDLSVPVSLTGSGLPRIIPAFHRRMILRRDHVSDRLVQFYLSLFSINRIIPTTKKVTKSTFKSIVSPPRDPDSISEVVSELKCVLRSLTDRYLPRVQHIPLHQGMRFMPTWKALPTQKVVQSVLVNRCKIPLQEALSIKSSFLALPYELASWTSLVEFVHARGEQWSQGYLWPSRTRFALDQNNITNCFLALI